MGKALPTTTGISIHPAWISKAMAVTLHFSDTSRIQAHRFPKQWNYLCLGNMDYRKNREVETIMLVGKKIMVTFMFSRCWGQDNLWPKFSRVWCLNSYIIFFYFSLSCGKAVPLLVWWWRKYLPKEEATGNADTELQLFKSCQMFGREQGTYLQVFFIQLP